MIDYGDTIAAEEFVERVEDVAPVDIAYEKEPDFRRYGRQQVVILLTDAGGNVTSVEAWLTVSLSNASI